MVLVLHPTFDAAATTAFFGTPAQLNLEARTIAQLAIEGIANVVDLTDFTKDDIDSMTRNFERPPRILNGAGNLVVQAAFTFPMKSQIDFTLRFSWLISMNRRTAKSLLR